MGKPVKACATGWIDSGTIKVHNVQTYGARGDNSYDDAASIQAAIDDADDTYSGGTGGIVFFPKGVYIVNSQIKIKNKVRLVGVGSRGSVIRAGGAFPTSTPLIRIGDGTSIVFGSRIEHMYIDANDISGSTCVYTTEANEQCGVFNCVLNGYRSYGFDLASLGGALMEIDTCEVYGSTSGSTAGIHLAGTSNIVRINHVTVNGASASPATHGVHNVSSQCTITALHCEYATHGVTFDTSATGSIIGMIGHSSLTNCVQILTGGGGGITLIDINGNGATNAVLDSLTGRTIASLVNFYMVSQSGSAGSGKQAFSSDGAATWQINSPILGQSGSFTCNAASTTTISNGNLNSTSQIVIFPFNAAAGLLTRTKTCYADTRATDSFVFNVSATGAGAPAGTEVFFYMFGQT